MNDLKDINERLCVAKEDKRALEELLTDYLPFIKKQLAGMGHMGIEYDDMLSVAMLTFVNCVQQYKAGRGNFLSFTAGCIRNRLIDECRKEIRYSSKVIAIAPEPSDGEDIQQTEEERAALREYSKEQERKALSDEIDGLSAALGPYGIAFADLPNICPRQDRARALCAQLARAVAWDEGMRDAFLKKQRIPQAQLALQFSISPKTVEKHRKYIVVLTVLLIGDYPCIQAFLPREVV